MHTTTNEASGLSRRRNVYRAVAFTLALTVIVLWVVFVYGIFGRVQGFPAPGGIMLPIFYCILAATAARAAIKDEPIVLTFAGGLSLVPAGLFLFAIPGVTRYIALSDLTILVMGILLVRSHPGREEDDVEVPSPEESAG